MEWLHRDGSGDKTHRLRLLAGRSSASLSGIKLTCNCGKTESMAGTFNFDADTGGALHKIGHDCTGSMPWLGRTRSMAGVCGEYLRVVQRGSSNVYFPLTVSSIHLPLWGEATGRAINRILDNPKIWTVLTAGLDEGKFIQQGRCETLAASRGVDAEELREVAQKKLDGTATQDGGAPHSEEEFRRQEYEALRAGRGGNTTDLLVEVRASTPYGPDLAGMLKGVCLVKKLRETRVLVGFSRLLPVEDPASDVLLPIAQDENLGWRPAAVVYGEGIFLEFNLHTLSAWSQSKKLKGRLSALQEHYNRRRVERGLRSIEVSPKFVFLHTFAHTLINQLSFDCGYGSASLRERVYCEAEDAGRPMQGVLIYTASGDSEGTLGGLVRQGEPDRLTASVKHAIRRSLWCSSDPVCIESAGQGSDNANLAACHGCALLPETSCETGNRLLDRGLLIGTPSDPEIGFFSDLVESLHEMDG